MNIVDDVEEEVVIREVKRARSAQRAEGCAYDATCESFNCLGRTCGLHSTVAQPGKRGIVFSTTDWERIEKRHEYSDIAQVHEPRQAFVRAALAALEGTHR